MASPNPDKARMWFAREDAPYLSYLSSLKPDWDHSGEVYRELTRNMVRQGIHRVTAPNERVAQILDVRYDHAAGKNTIKSVKSIGGHTLHEGPTWAPDREFFPSLPACDVGVHTRIVALSNDMRIHRYRQRAQARSTSLVCWSLVPRAPLGCRAGSTAGGSDPLLRLERGAALAGTERGSCVRTVLWAHCCLFRPAAIERWSFSLLRLVSRVLPMKLSCSMLTSVAVFVYPVSLNGIPCGPEPPAPSEMLMHQKVNAPLKGMGPTSFEYRMRRELEASKPLEEQTPCLQWFDAMIHLRCISFKIKIENLEERWERICTKEDNLVELTSCWHEATDLGATLQRAWSGVHYSDAETERLLRQQVEEITARLRGFMERARVVSTEAKGAIDTQIHFTNMEAAKLTIKESKSAIALTILAFVFIPINLASSIFGMNVQQINETGHSIWGFVVAALAMLAASGLSWTSWQAVQNWMFVQRAIRIHDGQDWGERGLWEKIRIIAHIYLEREQWKSNGRFLATVFGFRTGDRREFTPRLGKSI